MSFTTKSSSTLRKASPRFDSLKSSDSGQKSTFVCNRTSRNRNYYDRELPQQHSTSSSTLFSVKNTSLADFIPGASENSENKKYISPAMRRREQVKESRFHHQNEFTSANSKKSDKKKLLISTSSFPSMGETPQPKSTEQQPSSNQYANAVTISDEDYKSQQRKKEAMISDNTEYQATDKLSDEKNQASYDEEDDPEHYSEFYVDPKKPVCPYEAGKAAMSMLRFHQHKRDELNDLLGGQSPYWQEKSLLDFTFDSGDDSDYHESSSEEENNNDDDDDY